VSGTHHFLTDARFGTSPVHQLDPRAKLVGFVGFTVVVVSTPANALWAFALYAAILLFLLGLSRLPLRYVARRALIVVPFVLVVAVFLPFLPAQSAGRISLGGLQVSGQGLLVLWNVTVKALLGVLSMIVLVSTTSFSELIAGMEGLHVPRIFTLIASFMYRYSFLFIEEYKRMRRAMESRNYRARWLGDAPMLGHVLSALFLRSYSRGERVYVAMVSRGYEGSMRSTTQLAFRTADAVFLVVMAALLLSVRLAVPLT
jgi:cobalt/nickel transport system permease protein